MVTGAELLNQAETAAVWATVGGVIARVIVWHPLRKLIALVTVAREIADRLDTRTDGGLQDLVTAIQQNSPPPSPRR